MGEVPGGYDTLFSSAMRSGDSTWVDFSKSILLQVEYAVVEFV